MEDAGWDADRVHRALHDARSQDNTFGSGSILGSMCTAPHALAAAAHAMFLETNLGDPGHFPGAARLEREVLDDLVDLVSGPATAGARLLTGGTEANLLACHVARQVTGGNRIVVPETAHFSFDKAARLLRMELVRVPTRDHRADPDATAAATGPDTALVVGIAGNTELGLVDPIGDLAAVAAAHGVPLHVDAAFGGYVLPFLEGAAPWDLRLDGVWSIGLDPHKMGMAPTPAGALVIRDEAAWDSVAVETGYVSTERQSTLMGTRPGAAAAAVWAAHRAMGRDGYRDTVRACMATTRRIADGIRQAGATLVAAPELNVVTFRAGDAGTTARRLAQAGFRLNTVPRLGALRIVVNPHVSDDVADRFLAALQDLTLEL